MDILEDKRHLRHADSSKGQQKQKNAASNSKLLQLSLKATNKGSIETIQGNHYVYLTVLTAQESMNRKASAKRYGDYFYSKTWKHWKCYPILWWNDEQIDKYIQENEMPLCEIYKWDEIEGYKIWNGCWCCPQAWKFGKGKWLKKGVILCDGFLY